MIMSRNRLRVGRQVTYFPTDTEASTGNGSAGDQWPATITKVNSDGTVNLSVHEADGGFIAKTSVVKGVGKGTFSPTFGLAQHPAT
jgi:hypothetical protein